MHPKTLENILLELVSGSPQKLTFLDLCRRVRAQGLPADPTRLRPAVRALVSAGELAYRAHLGRSVLEISFDRPMPVGNRLVLVPVGRGYRPPPDRVPIYLQHGAAFGRGAHPTTRLALQGIESLPAPAGRGPSGPLCDAVLDIGTGSGVLIIAAVASGFAGGVGIDTDPCARAEALENLRLNGMQARVRISDRPPAQPDGRFALVTANLRAPTLAAIAAGVARRTRPGGHAVLSGLRPEEWEDVRRDYLRQGFRCRWQAEELGWSAAAFEMTGG